MGIRDSLPTDPSERRKLFIVVGVIAVCAVWLTYFIASHIEIRPTAKAPSSPGWMAAHEINQKLEQDRAFVDVGLAVVSEKPLKFAVNGGVWKKEDLDRLPGVLKELKPDAEFELHVEILRR